MGWIGSAIHSSIVAVHLSSTLLVMLLITISSILCCMNLLLDQLLPLLGFDRLHFRLRCRLQAAVAAAAFVALRCGALARAMRHVCPSSHAQNRLTSPLLYS